MAKKTDWRVVYQVFIRYFEPAVFTVAALDQSMHVLSEPMNLPNLIASTICITGSLLVLVRPKIGLTLVCASFLFTGLYPAFISFGNGILWTLFALGFLCSKRPLWLGWSVSGLCTLSFFLFVVEDIKEWHLSLYSIFLMLTPAIFGTFILLQRENRQKQTLLAMAKRIEITNKFTAMIHDSITRTLVELCTRLEQSDDNRELAALARRALSQLRSVSVAIRGETDAPENNKSAPGSSQLLYAILEEAKETLTKSGFNVTLIRSIQEHTLSQTKIININSCIDETVANIIKYGDRNTPVNIVVTAHGNSLIFFESNGISAEPRKDPIPSSHVGLAAIARRVKSDKGSFNSLTENDIWSQTLRLPI